jgi:hypothetical protein
MNILLCTVCSLGICISRSQLHPVKLLAGSGVENALVGGEGGQAPSGPAEATLLAFKQKLTVVKHTHDLRGSFDGHADGTGASI